jgi:hypothetical protein
MVNAGGEHINAEKETNKQSNNNNYNMNSVASVCVDIGFPCTVTQGIMSRVDQDEITV